MAKKKLTGKQTRYLFAKGILKGSGKGKNRKVTYKKSGGKKRKAKKVNTLGMPTKSSAQKRANYVFNKAAKVGFAAEIAFRDVNRSIKSRGGVRKAKTMDKKLYNKHQNLRKQRNKAQDRHLEASELLSRIRRKDTKKYLKR